jgi:hypothetical protein
MGMSLMFFLATMAWAVAEPDWSIGAKVPAGGRPNPYQFATEEFAQKQIAGKIHAQIYPVEVSGLLPPLRPLENFFASDERSFLKSIARFFLGNFTGIRSMNDLLAWVGLNKYPKPSAKGVYAVPYPNGMRPNHRLGFGEVLRSEGTGFSISCAACHSGTLFGKTVLGLSNRFPRANEAFHYAQKFVPHVPLSLFRAETDATAGEVELFARSQRSLASIGVKIPVVAGLDTSLAQVALSLAKRQQDRYVSFSRRWEKSPREEPLENFVADSKPAVWWNVKYKNRWLSDGSVIAGNPIYTNILWNEIGRGTDLRELEGWLKRNERTIHEITTAVFSMQAPRITDFFPAEKISLERAKRGETVFLQRCAKCHGVYEKAWNLPNFSGKSLAEQLATVRVHYHEKTPVIDVGTDPQRWQGMKSLEQLNQLKISQENGILVKAQRGYVPPPLEGIWARWPYFHNNSIPNLCALLTAGKKRPKIFYMGDAKSKADFDFGCNGYPLQKVPREWKRSERRYNTQKAGLSNLGHDEGIFQKVAKSYFPSKKNMICYSFYRRCSRYPGQSKCLVFVAGATLREGG